MWEGSSWGRGRKTRVVGWSLKAGRDKRGGCSPRASTKGRPCRPLDCSPVRSMWDLGCAGQQDDKPTLLSTTTFGVICCISNRKTNASRQPNGSFLILFVFKKIWLLVWKLKCRFFRTLFQNITYIRMNSSDLLLQKRLSASVFATRLAQ